MSGKDYEKIIRESNTLFENPGDYQNPFVKFGKPSASQQILANLQAPEPVDSATKPEFPVDKKEDDEGATGPGLPEETESEGEESDEEEDGKGNAEGNAPIPSSWIDAPMPFAPASAQGDRRPSQGLSSRPSDEVDPQTDQPSSPSPSGKRPAPGGPKTPITARKDRDRGSSELSPFSNTHQRKPSVTLRPGSNPTSVRTGGVTSPPPSDAASIAGERLDEEDPLGHPKGDTEELMDMVRTGVKKPNVPPPGVKPSKRPQLKASALSSQRTSAIGSIETVVASNHEVRIASLEELVKELLEQNKTLVLKTDAMITEMSNLRTEMIREMNEKTKRVGGPLPSLAVTAPSPVSGPGEATIPSNVVASNLATATQSMPSAAGGVGLTGAALMRYNARMALRKK